MGRNDGIKGIQVLWQPIRNTRGCESFVDRKWQISQKRKMKRQNKVKDKYTNKVCHQATEDEILAAPIYVDTSIMKMQQLNTTLYPRTLKDHQQRRRGICMLMH